MFPKIFEFIDFKDLSVYAVNIEEFWKDALWTQIQFY